MADRSVNRGNRMGQVGYYDYFMGGGKFQEHLRTKGEIFMTKKGLNE